MERRSWPWKKKSPDKVSVAMEPGADPLLSPAPQGEDDYKKRDFVQISSDTYSGMIIMEERSKEWETQVKAMEDEISDLNNRLHLSISELSAKDDLVKQHVKVAEDAVSGWEKAEAEASELKKNLDSVTSSRISAESRASHLDDALKECMRQVRTLRDEHDHNLHQLALSKSSLWETAKLELLRKIDSLDHDLLRSTAENATLSTSLNERSALLLKLEKDKAAAFAEIELLKSNLGSLQRELNSVKYEFLLASKEVEIRNEERDMSVKSAQALNRQHLDDVKKIARLEAECHRLRALVRKKLPGPGALAQMRLETDGSGRDSATGGVKKRTHARNISQHLPPLPDPIQRENRYLSDQLLAMEEEIKFLKGTIAENSSELKASRTLCATATTNIRYLEEQVTLNGDDPAKVGSKPSPVNNPFLSEGLGGKNEPSLSEDGESCTESWASALISELSQIRKEIVVQKLGAPHGSGLMDDFLEMEKLALLSENPGSPAPLPESSVDSELGGGRIDGSPGSAVLQSPTSGLNSGNIRSDICRAFESLKVDHLNSNDLLRGEEDLATLVLRIRDFFIFLEEEGAASGSGGWLGRDDAEEFYVKTDEFLQKKLCFSGYVEWLSPVLGKARDLARGFLLRGREAEAENQRLQRELERAGARAEELETAMGDVRSKMASTEKMNTLAETQVRCMTESYKSLENRAEELVAEVSALQAEIKVLESEVREERRGREEAEAQVNLLSQQPIRREESEDGGEVKKAKQWVEETTELEAAAEKLAECQETILILGKQMQAMQSSNTRVVEGGGLTTAPESTIRVRRGGGRGEADALSYYYSSALFSPCGTDGGLVGRSPMCTPGQMRLRPSKSGSSSSSSTSTSEKPTGRGFARFFTSKGKNNRR